MAASDAAYRAMGLGHPQRARPWRRRWTGRASTALDPVAEGVVARWWSSVLPAPSTTSRTSSARRSPLHRAFEPLHGPRPRRAGAHDQLGGHNHVPVALGALYDVVEQCDAALAHLSEVLSDGGQCGSEIGGFRSVIEADDAYVLGHAAACIEEATDHTERGLVVGREHGSHPGIVGKAGAGNEASMPRSNHRPAVSVAAPRLHAASRTIRGHGRRRRSSSEDRARDAPCDVRGRGGAGSPGVPPPPGRS